MLPRIHRLPSRERLVSPRSIHSPYFTLRVAPSSALHSRATVVISKKVDKRAVKRNYLRRQVSGVLEALLPRHKKPYDIVFVLKPSVIQLEPGGLQKAIDDAMMKAGLV